MKKFTIFFFSLIFLGQSNYASAFSVNHDIFVTIGTFDAAKVKMDYTLTPKNYQIDSLITTNGFFNTAYPFKAEYKTSGTIKKDKLITKDYGYTSKSRYNTRSKQVLYDNNGIPLYRITSKNGKNKKLDFPQTSEPTDTFDLQTVLAKIAQQYNNLGFCDSQLSVYDGKRRFNVIIKDEGTEELPQNENLALKGQAAKCSLHINKLLSEDDDTLWEFSANKPIYFWIIRNNEIRHPVIARIQIKDTPLGELNAYTTNFTIEE